MIELFTQTEINASDQKIWDCLMDFAHYRDWNPFVLSVQGEIRIGGIIEVMLQGLREQPQKFNPRVLRVDPLREFRWRGSLPIPGLFTGEHYFKIEPLATGKFSFIQGEKFTGLLVPLTSHFLRNHVLPGFDAMNEALQRRVEALS